MRQVVTTGNGGVEVLRVEEKPDPEPAADEVRVRVHAAGLNFADILARQGLYPDGPKKPCVMGYEVAGVVDKCGAGVDQNRSEERRVGKGWRSRWVRCHEKKKSSLVASIEATVDY